MKTFTSFSRLMFVGVSLTLLSFGSRAESYDVVDPDTGLNFIVNTSERSVSSVLFSGGKLADDGALPIPEYITYNGKRVKVTGIADNLNQLNPEYADKLTSLTTPAGIVSLPDSLFKNYKELTAVNLPDVVNLGAGTFKSCKKLTSVNLSQSLKEIPEQCFAFCSALETVSLPESLEFIGTRAFILSGITEITIPGNVYEVDFAAFYSCPLQTLTILGGNESPEKMLIDHYAFNTPTLSMIYCYRPVPPTIGGTGSAFSRTTYDKAVLKLLGDAQNHLADYENHPYWSSFAKGRPIETSVEGIESERELSGAVYNIDGVLLYENADADVISALPHGLYVIGGRLVRM